MDSCLNRWPVVAPGPLLVAAVLCSAALLFPAVLIAADATPYGESFVRLTAPPDGRGEPASRSPAEMPATPGAGASYREQLDQLELAGGPYAYTLAEPLADLARLSQQNGDIAAAQRLYERALHVVRINEGLYSEQQVPILQQLFASYRQAGDMETLDGRYDYFFRLYGGGKPPYTALRLNAALEYMRWQREALLIGLGGGGAARLMALFDLNQQVLDLAAQDPAVSESSYRALVLSQLRNLYLVQDRHRPALEDASAPPISLGAAGWTQQDINEHRLQSIQRKAISRGRELLQELIDRTPAGQPVELASIYLELADWNQWNDRRADALAAYTQVAELLQQADRPALLNEWLGAPQELPANGAFLRPAAALEEGAVMQARFDVSTEGRALNILVSAASEADEGKAGRFRRALSRVRFRPSYTGGDPAEQLQLSRDYLLFK